MVDVHSELLAGYDSCDEAAAHRAFLVSPSWSIASHIDVTHNASSHLRSRNELFSLSGVRGNFPQFFLVENNGKGAGSTNDDVVSSSCESDSASTIRFLGDWDKIEALNDASSLPDEILDANPSIITWEKVLGDSYLTASS